MRRILRRLWADDDAYERQLARKQRPTPCAVSSRAAGSIVRSSPVASTA
jgi:hypothetical protein